MSDLIRREDAYAAIRGLTRHIDRIAAIRALPAVQPKVKPLVWHEGDEPDEWKSGPYDVWREFGRYQLYHWSVVVGEPHKTASAAKAAAQADHEARILSALEPAAQPDAREAALRDIARQKKTDEMDTEYDVEYADWEGGYNAIIDVARVALCAVQPDTRIKEYEEAYQYALHLAEALRENYPPNPDFRFLGDLVGLLTQVDNMVAGLSQPAVRPHVNETRKREHVPDDVLTRAAKGVAHD